MKSPVKSDTGKQLTNTEKYPLHYAAFRARGPEAEAYALKLIADGMDVNQQDDAGRTPLIMLCHVCPSARIAQALVDAGADVNIKTNGGLTALGQLRNRGGECAKIREILIKAGAK